MARDCPSRMKSTSVEDERTLDLRRDRQGSARRLGRASGTATKNADGVTVVLTAPEAKTIEL